MSDRLEICDALIVADNNCGYQFCVGRLGSRWVGYAVGATDDGERMLFLFSEICEGHVMGIMSLEEAIRMTGALAQDPEQAYGGVDRWYVHDRLQASPDDYRCDHCDRVGCDGTECREVDDAYYYPL